MHAGLGGAECASYFISYHSPSQNKCSLRRDNLQGRSLWTVNPADMLPWFQGFAVWYTALGWTLISSFALIQLVRVTPRTGQVAE